MKKLTEGSEVRVFTKYTGQKEGDLIPAWNKAKGMYKVINIELRDKKICPRTGKETRHCHLNCVYTYNY